jgi:hypothetical protein
MGKFNDIITKLETIVNAVQYSGSSAFVDVKTYGTNDFDGYPSATIINAEITSEYSTTTQNLRTYVTYIYIYMNLEQTTEETAWDILRDLQEAIIDALDQSENLGGTVDFVRPTAATPVEANTGEGGRLIVAPVKVECAYSFYFK